MKEVKSPKKPLVYYYGIVILVLFFFNLFVSPVLMERQVKEVDYGTFMDMIDDMETACQLLKEGEILCIREGERVLFFGLRNERVQVMSAQAHYVLDLCAFAEMFAGEQFTVWTRRGEEEICEEKDAEYYSWTHK